MKMKLVDIIKKSSVEYIAKIIGSVVAMNIDGISAEEAIKLEYKETLKVLQSEMEVDYKQTNADRIRQFSDEELADFIRELNERCLAGAGMVDCSNNTDCIDCKGIVLEWLQSEVEET